MTSFRFALVFLLTGLMIVLVAPGAAPAQQQHEGNSRHELNLPAWSRPSPMERPYSQDAPQAPPDVQQQPLSVPEPGDGPPQAPLGGVEWLALAGGVYAISRLRHDPSSDDDEDEH